MTKRELTEIEKNISSKNLTFMKTEAEYLEKVILARKKLAIDTSELEYHRQLKVLEKEYKEKTIEFEELTKHIQILQDQIDNGVEEKEIKENEKEEQ